MWNCLCPICGNEFVALPAKVFSRHTSSCGCKRISSGESVIESVLRDLGVVYQKEMRFADCRDKYSLPFDFAVYKENEVALLIEYDGEQHFRSVEFFGGEEAFLVRERHDEIKNAYCKSKSIPLLRCNYLDSDMEIKTKITNIIYP